MKGTIIQCMKEVAFEAGLSLVEDLGDQTVLLESGLDSLSFAVLVVTLEERLGYDPFQLMNEPVYPRTLGELVGIYERYSEHCGDAR